MQTVAEISTGLINGIANLSIATFGYSMLFITQILPKKDKIVQPASNMTKITAFIGIISLFLLLFSSLLAINQPNDYQHMHHQRYTAPVIQSLWILGLAQWINREKQINLSNRLILCLSPVLLALIIGSVLWNYNNRFSIIDAMSSGTSVISNVLNSQNQPLASLAIGSIVIITVQSLSWRPKLVFAGIFSSIVGINVSSTRGDILKDSSKRPDLINEAKILSKTNQVCLVSIKTDLNANESENLYEFYLSSSKIIRLRNKYQNRTKYNRFYNPDPRECDYIITPLDLHIPSHRTDLETIHRKLNQCKIDKVDDRLGWALSKCKNNSKAKNYKFSTTSNGVKTGILDASVKPIRVYTEEDLKHEKGKLTYGTVTTDKSEIKVVPCKSLSSEKERRVCIINRQIIMDPTPEIPLIWGIYIQDLKAGNYQLIPSGLRIYQGEITVEIVDESINRLNSKSYNLVNSSITPIPFTLEKDKQQIELRIVSTADAIFEPPSHWIIQK